MRKHSGFSWLVAMGLAFVAAGCSRSKTDKETRNTATNDVQPLTKQWEKVIPTQAPPAGLESLSAAECGACHEEIYREWKASNHAVALQDPQFQAEWAKDKHLWVCANCHTPLQNQQEFIILGKQGSDYFKPVQQANPHFDRRLQEESITCAVCHVRDGAVIGTRGDSTTSPHAVRKDAGLRLQQELCLSCHNVEDALTPTLICAFGTGEEWKASSYPQTGRDCIACHMPAVYRRLTANSPARWTRQHTWIGSAIPKFLGADSLVNGYNSGLDIDVRWSPKKLTAGDSIFVTVVLTNQNAGHDLPTGDPEYFITIEFRVVDEHERTLQDTTFRIGQEWQWWPEARKLSDNRLKPLEQRTYSLVVAIPHLPLSCEAFVTSHRMTIENAKAMGLLGKYPIKTVIHRRKFRL